MLLLITISFIYLIIESWKQAIAIVPSDVDTTDVTPVDCFELTPIGDNELSQQRTLPSNEPVRIPPINV